MGRLDHGAVHAAGVLSFSFSDRPGRRFRSRWRGGSVAGRGTRCGHTADRCERPRLRRRGGSRGNPSIRRRAAGGEQRSGPMAVRRPGTLRDAIAKSADAARGARPGGDAAGLWKHAIGLRFAGGEHTTGVAGGVEPGSAHAFRGFGGRAGGAAGSGSAGGLGLGSAWRYSQSQPNAATGTTGAAGSGLDVQTASGYGGGRRRVSANYGAGARARAGLEFDHARGDQRQPAAGAGGIGCNAEDGATAGVPWGGNWR